MFSNVKISTNCSKYFHFVGPFNVYYEQLPLVKGTLFIILIVEISCIFPVYI